MSVSATHDVPEMKSQENTRKTSLKHSFSKEKTLRITPKKDSSDLSQVLKAIQNLN